MASKLSVDGERSLGGRVGISLKVAVGIPLDGRDGARHPGVDGHGVRCGPTTGWSRWSRDGGDGSGIVRVTSPAYRQYCLNLPKRRHSPDEL